MTMQAEPFRRSVELRRKNMYANIVAGNIFAQLASINILLNTVNTYIIAFSIHLIVFEFYHILTIRSGPDGSLVHRCECCPIYFKTTDERDEHHIAVHKMELSCNICNKFCTKLNNLYKHQRYCLTGPEKRSNFVCAKCGA